MCTSFFIFIFVLYVKKKKNDQIIKRKYIMTNIDTQETDYSVYSSTRHTKTDIYHTVTHLYISCSYYFSFLVLIFPIQFDICRPVTYLKLVE